MISLVNDNILQQFYVNPLSKNQKKFLEKSDHRGLSNPSQTRKDITEQLIKSFRWMYHVLEHRENLKQYELYRIFNALNLFGFLRNILLEPKNELSLDEFSYDFRTTEIARLMFEMSSRYLSESNQFRKDPYVKENLDRISQNFKTLSNSALEKEDADKTISFEEQMKLQDKIWELDEDGIFDPDEIPDYSMTAGKENKYLINNLLELNFEYDELKKLKTKNKTKLIKENREKFNQIKKHWLQNKKFITKEIYGHNEIFWIKQKLQKKYGHISAYFCRLNKLHDAPDLPLSDFGRDIANKLTVFHRYD